MPLLRVIAGPDRGRVFPLDAETTIGFGSGSDIPLTDERTVAKQVVVRREDHAFTIRNRVQKHFLFVNGRVVLSSQLALGDEIRLGGTVLRLEADASGAAKVEEGEGPLGSASDSRIQERIHVYTDTDAFLKSVETAGDMANRRLTTIYRVASTIAAIADFDELLDRMLTIIFDHLPVDRGFVLLADDRGRLEPKVAHVRGKGRVNVAPRLSRTILAEVVRNRQAVLSMDAATDSRFAGGESIADLSIRSVMSVPLVAGEKLLGVIHVDSSLRSHAFTRGDLDLLTGIGLQASLAIERFRLAREKAEKDRIEEELRQAGVVQRFLLPRRLPMIPGLEFGISYRLSQGLGGDYYDFVDAGPGRLAIVVADVSGHGMASALVMSMCRALLRTFLAREGTPAGILAEANAVVERDTMAGMFVTVFLGILDYHDLTLVYANAGHNPPLLFGGDKTGVQELKTGGLPLGMMPVAHYREDRVRLAPGDMLVVFTDGFPEARNPANEMYGKVRFQEAVGRGHGRAAPEVAASVYGDLSAFVGDREPEDDLTLIVARIDPRRRGLRFRTAPGPAALAPALERLVRLVDALGVPEADLTRVRAGLREAATVALLRPSPAGPVTVEACSDTTRIRVVFRPAAGEAPLPVPESLADLAVAGADGSLIVAFQAAGETGSEV